MTATAPGGDPNPSVEVRLERIQAAIDVGNAETKGKLEIVLLRHAHFEQLAEERERRAVAELGERDARLDKLEKAQEEQRKANEAALDAQRKAVEAQSRRVWFLAGGASALGVVANVGVQLLVAHR